MGSSGAKGLADGIRNITIQRPDKMVGGLGRFKTEYRSTQNTSYTSTRYSETTSTTYTLKGDGTTKHNKITGFALKQLEKRFPKGVKGLKNFYNWTTNPEEEFNLLAKIVKSL